MKKIFNVKIINFLKEIFAKLGGFSECPPNENNVKNVMNIMLKDFVEEELKLYNWEFEYKINEHYPFCEIVFPYVIISFYHDTQYHSIICSFYDVNDDALIKNGYYLSSLLTLNKIDTSSLYYEYSSVSIEKYIKQYVKYIHENLMYLVRGEFESFKSYTALKKNATYPKSIIKKIT